jgi:hypothetical protein
MKKKNTQIFLIYGKKNRGRVVSSDPFIILRLHSINLFVERAKVIKSNEAGLINIRRMYITQCVYCLKATPKRLKASNFDNHSNAIFEQTYRVPREGALSICWWYPLFLFRKLLHIDFVTGACND